jgi:hypothetical protein
MTAAQINGVAVVADEPTRSRITDNGGNPVFWRQVRKLRLADDSTVFGCVHCTFVRESPMAVLTHLPMHSNPMLRPQQRSANPLVAALATERDRQGLSLRLMERRTGYPRATLRRWETGKTDPSITSVQDYAMALGFDLRFVRRPAAVVREAS